MTKFIWCSAHTPSAEQVAELVSVWGMSQLVMLKDIYPSTQDFLNNCPNDYNELLLHAMDMHEIARSENAMLVQVGGSPAFQYIMGKVSMTGAHRSSLLYAYSERISEDIPQEDGSVKKVSVFKHKGFMQV